MKRLRLFAMVMVVALGVSTVARAEEPYDGTIQAARRMRAVGVILTTLGMAVATTGTVMAIVGRSGCGNHAGSEECIGGAIGEGLGFAASSILLVAPGLPLWFIGDQRVKKAERAVSLHVTPVIGGYQQGATASLSFRF